MLTADALGAVMVVAAIVFGIVGGAYLPFHVCADVPGFNTGMLLGAVFALAACMPTTYLFGGWGEEMLGTDVGVPVGVFVGCFIGTAASCFILGAIGVLASRLKK